jgi:hypothetical protein
MRSIIGLLSLVLVLVIGYFIYSNQYDGEKKALAPKKQIDLIGVRMDLTEISRAEKLYAALNGSYATLEELQREESIPFQGTENRGYSYEINLEGAERYRITATPIDPEKSDWPTLSIDQTGQVVVSE